MKKIIRICMCCGMFVLLLVTAPAFADNDARDYVPLPAGTTLLATYFNHVSATNFYSKGKKVSSDTNLGANIGVLRPVYYTQLGPFTMDPQAIIPFGEESLHVNGTGGGEVKSSGLADPIVTATVWFINDPKSKTWLGFTPFLTVPLGEYDKNKAINLGANRFAFKPEIGFVKGFGNLLFDLTANVEFYTDNKDFSPAGVTLKQDPVFTVETHMSYDFNQSFFTSLDYFYHNGGKTTVAGVKQDDAKDDHTLGLTLGFMLSPSYQLLLKYKQDLSVENGLKTNTIGARIAYFF